MESYTHGTWESAIQFVMEHIDDFRNGRTDVYVAGRKRRLRLTSSQLAELICLAEWRLEQCQKSVT